MLKRIGKLEYEPGWMGGRWLVTDEITKQDLPKEVILDIKRKKVKAKPVLISGQDYDMGHIYDWTALDFMLQLDTVIGVVEVSLIDIIREKKLKSLILFVES